MGSDPRSQATAMSACAPGQPMVRTESSGWLRKNTGNSRSDEELPNKVQKKEKKEMNLNIYLKMKCFRFDSSYPKPRNFITVESFEVEDV